MSRQPKPSEALQSFSAFMRSATSAGAIDDKTKEMITLALSRGVHCDDCARVHVKKAKELGISEEEMAEIAALAVVFGGVKTMWLWNECRKAQL